MPLRLVAPIVLCGLAVSHAGFSGEEGPRAARSVHLWYAASEAAAFYLEVTVEKSTPGSYFMACGFRQGYFGIQELAGGKKVVLFSVWDPTKGDDPERVPRDRVEVIHRAEDVRVRRFGGEGTGVQSFFDYDWRTGETYKFCVRASREGQKTAFAAYFWISEKKSWKHLATFRTKTGGKGLEGLYSFVEDFRRDSKSAREVRRAVFGNVWTLDEEGKWHAVREARFTASEAPWEAKETIDAGVKGGRFYLQTGGDTRATTPLGSAIKLPGEAERLDSRETAGPPQCPQASSERL